MKTIQINKDWRITKNDSEVYFLEEHVNNKWLCYVSGGPLSRHFAFYVRQVLSDNAPDTPQALISLLRTLTGEIEAVIEQEGK